MIIPNSTGCLERKKGAGSVPVASSSFSTDGKKATLETAQLLTAGTYTVHTIVSPSSGAPATYEKTVVAENERVADIAFTLDSLRIVTVQNGLTHLVTKFKLTNQYDEDVTLRYGSESGFNIVERVAPDSELSVSASEARSVSSPESSNVPITRTNSIAASHR